MEDIDYRILSIDKTICDNIDMLDFSFRGLVSQNLLSQLRNFVEHIAMKIYSEVHELKVGYNDIKSSLEYIKHNNEFLFLRKFHRFLQMSASHYTPDYEGAERLILKYYEYLLLTKNFLKERYQLDVLRNIDIFPINTDKTLQEYYAKIIQKLFEQGTVVDHNNQERFYVKKSKAFFVNGQVYYENTLVLANDAASKFDRFVAFSKFLIPTNYAIKATLVDEQIEISQKLMPVKLLTEWTTSIRPCELNNFVKIFRITHRIHSRGAEYNGIMKYLTISGMSLVDVIELSEEDYRKTIFNMSQNAKRIKFLDVLDACRTIILNNAEGSNIIRYLLYTMRNKVIKQQFDRYKYNNYPGSGLCLRNGTIPFDEMPFATNPLRHKAFLSDIYGCIDANGREHEFLARFVDNNAVSHGKLYTEVDEVGIFGNTNELIDNYNQRLYKTHQSRRLETFGNYIVVDGHEEKTAEIIRRIIEFTKSGIGGYENSIRTWLSGRTNFVDCEEKKEILKHMFSDSKVAMIYGAAGTGKSTLVDYIAHFWDDQRKLCLANTNPAVENLRRKVSARNCEFMTIKKFTSQNYYETKHDILIIDECSMVSNNDMLDILNKSEVKLLILVGDIYQIEAISFGNWFYMSRYFVPNDSRYELTIPYRAKDKSELLELWSKVRTIEDDITEHIVNNGYAITLNESIFEMSAIDEIILCLNYDGLYGINNINRFLQNNNPNTAVAWGIWIYKIGDPVLFNDSIKYVDVLYNNLKGRIINIELGEEVIFFTIEIDKVINELNIDGMNLELLEPLNPEKSIIRFSVSKAVDNDNDDEDLEAIVPFQIAYAVSIHKAQGLEYESVKIVITEEIDEMITHNIFYTAITRAKDKLKIYWTPESQQRVISSFMRIESKHEANLLAARRGLKMVKLKH